MTKTSPERISELRHALNVGLAAIGYMANEHAASAAQFTFGAAYSLSRSDGSTAHETFGELETRAIADLETLLLKVSDAMNWIGDAINGMDGVEDDDESATDHAFGYVRRVLGKGN
jgi:hypothetical protein